MTAAGEGTALAGKRRQLLVLSAVIAAVLIVIATMASYGMHRIDRSVAENTAAIGRMDALADAARTAQVSFKTQVQEWKNTLLRGHVAKDYEAYHGAFELRRAEVQRDLDALIRQANEVGFPDVDIQALKAAHRDLGAVYDEALTKFDAGDPMSVRAADAVVRGRDRPVNEAFDALVATVKSHTDGKREEFSADISDVSARMSRRLWVAVGLGLAVLVVGAFVSLGAVRKY